MTQKKTVCYQCVANGPTEGPLSRMSSYLALLPAVSCADNSVPSSFEVQAGCIGTSSCGRAPICDEQLDERTGKVSCLLHSLGTRKN